MWPTELYYFGCLTHPTFMFLSQDTKAPANNHGLEEDDLAGSVYTREVSVGKLLVNHSDTGLLGRGLVFSPKRTAFQKGSQKLTDDQLRTISSSTLALFPVHWHKLELFPNYTLPT